MNSEGPTVFLEPKALYNDPLAETVVPEDFEVPFGKARVRRSGSDLSIITYGNTTHMAVQVADRISDETGKEIEVLDLRSLSPLDKEAIMETVKENIAGADSTRRQSIRGIWWRAGFHDR